MMAGKRAGVVVLLLGVWAGIVIAPLREAAACSCARPLDAARRYYRDAGVVFVGRAERASSRGKAGVQPLRVLWALKGQLAPGSRYEIERGSPCSAYYHAGDVALVFAKQRSASVCAGNYALSVLLPDLPAVLREAAKARGQQVQVPTTSLRVGLQAALGGYLHGRRSIPLSSRDLPKLLKLKLGASTLFATRTIPKHGIILQDALQVGPLAFLAGSYPREGVVFSVLLLHAPRKGAKSARTEVLYKQVAERKASTNPLHRNMIP